MTQGSCLDSDPDLFHSDAAPTLRLAAAVCNAGPCPVIDKCLRYALDNMDDGWAEGPERQMAIGQYGVWGGSLPIDRWRMLGRRKSRTERHVA